MASQLAAQLDDHFHGVHQLSPAEACHFGGQHWFHPTFAPQPFCRLPIHFGGNHLLRRAAATGWLSLLDAKKKSTFGVDIGLDWCLYSLILVYMSFNGNIIYFYGPFSMAMLNNQRVSVLPWIFSTTIAMNLVSSTSWTGENIMKTLP